MGWKLLSLQSLPEPGEVIWCKWPQRETRGQPGPVVRPVLVRERYVLADPRTGTEHGVVLVSYGTGQFDETHRGKDLIVEPMARARELGLHKPTRFCLDNGSSKHLIWCEDYFVPPGYVLNRGLVIGRLNEAERDEVRRCLAARGLS